MELILERKIHNATSTEGNLWINDGTGWKWFCHTIEDVVRAKPGEWKSELKVYAKTAIPYGRYKILSTWSNKFQRLLTLVCNVPDFLGIRIHNGSSETSSAGCIIVSYKNDDGADGKKNRIVNDKKAMNDLNSLVLKTQKKEDIWLTIVDKKEDAESWS